MPEIPSLSDVPLSLYDDEQYGATGPVGFLWDKSTLPIEATDELPMHGDTYDIREVGIDWITATASTPDRRRGLLELGVALVGGQVALDNQPRQSRILGYTGRGAGGAFAGQRDDSVLVRCSGDTAAAHWREVYPLADNISRLDLQVTVQGSEGDLSLGNDHYRQAVEAERRAQRPPTATRVESSRGGFTLYLGSRASDRFGRIYAKGPQSKLERYRDCWRYELELKRDYALRAAQQLDASPTPATAIAATVWSFLWARGIRAPFVVTGDEVEYLGAGDPGDEERRLDWTARAVAPFLTGLVERGYAGRLDVALERLDRARRGHMEVRA